MDAPEPSLRLRERAICIVAETNEQGNGAASGACLQTALILITIMVEEQPMDSYLLAHTGWFRIAVQSLVLLAETDGVCKSTTIAQELKAHATFLRRVMASLVQAQIVVAREGRDGGYRLSRPPEGITLADVYRATRSVCQVEESASREISTNIHVQQAFGEIACEIEHSFLALLERYTIASLMEKTPNPLNMN
jgi:Rrf2 family transcriptional regulator, repressor of oqxAB